MRRKALLTPLVVGLALAGCGSNNPHRAQPHLLKGPASCTVGPGTGVMGACTPKPFGATFNFRASGVSGGLIPDVSEFQPHVNWAAAKGHIAGAIARAADGNHTDTEFARNWHELRRLQIWHAAYFFLRPFQCWREADRLVALVNAAGGFDSGPAIADAEVPLSANCTQEFVQRVEFDLRWNTAVVYTAPGTWPGGGHGNAVLWVATYGSHPGCVWTCTYVAWQYTDGIFGPQPHGLAGVGSSDISTNNGITSITRHVPETHTQLQRRLFAAYRARNTLRALRLKHRCAVPPKHGGGKWHHPCTVWTTHGQHTNKEISYLKWRLHV